MAQDFELGLPQVRNYPTKEYGTDPQNFSVTQDSKGIMYFGNMSGILEFDDKAWRLIDFEGWPYLTNCDDGRVYVGGFNDFGYLAPDSNGFTSFFSLKNKFLKHIEFDAVFNVASHGRSVFFETDNQLFHYHNDIVQLIDTNESRYTVFTTDKDVFINHSKYGLSRFRYNTIQRLPGGDFFKGKHIVDILPYGNSVLVKLNNQEGFYQYDYKEVKPKAFPIDPFLKRYNYTHGVVLSNGHIAIGTNDNGIIIVDNNGHFLTHINKNNGLNDNSVYMLYPDRSGNIWAGLRNGISKIVYPNHFTYFDFAGGLHGAVLSVYRYKGKLYAGTLSGAFVLDKCMKNDEPAIIQNQRAFSQLNDISAMVYQFLEFKGMFLAITDHGIYRIDGGSATQLHNQPLRYAVTTPAHPDHVFIVGLFGFAALKFDNGKFTMEKPAEEVDCSVRTLILSDEGDFWLGSNNFGVFRIEPFNEYHYKIPVTNYKQTNNLPPDHGWIDVYNTEKGVLFSAESGHLLRFDTKNEIFEADTLIGIPYIDEEHWIYPIYESNIKTLVMSRGSNKTFKKETMVAFFDSVNNAYDLITAPFNQISDFTVENFLVENEKILWIGGADGLIRFDRSQLKTDSTIHSILIKQIVLGDDSIIPIMQDVDYAKRREMIKIEPHFNSMQFDYICPAFTGDESILYQIFLENFDETWSDWSYDSNKEYNFLKPGKYNFRVRAKSVYGLEYGQANIEFVILAPYYQSILAYLFYGVFFLVCIYIFFRYRSYQFAKEKNKLEKIIKERTDELLKEIERAEDLLVNMLPKPIATELKVMGKTSTQKFDLASIMFTDIQGFTQIAELIDPSVLVDKLEELFLHFDTIVEKYRIEKIKTIGDGYMCAAGIPEKDRINPIKVVLAALEIREYMKTFEFDREKTKHLKWGLRIGIHSGAVIAGVISTKRYSYDVWGVTVNSASRMESKGEVGQINISEGTHALVRNYFDCKYNGVTYEKGGTELKMYIVEKLKPAWSNDPNGIYQNDRLQFELFEIRYLDLYDSMIEKLKKELPNNLYYHNLKHTIDVCVQAEIIAQAEGVSNHDIILLKTAALFHDSGFTIGYDNHELHGVKIARDVLPRYQYTPSQIEIICQLIMVTKIPPHPKTHLEKVMCDADLDYLGRRDFVEVSRNLFMELYERKRIKSVDEWMKKQINFIERHTYFTETAKANRNVNKNQQLENIRQMDFLSSFF